MTIYHKKIIKYMQLKGELAGKHFFKKADETAILSWKPVKAEYAWRSLADNIKMLNKYGIVPWTCPFCILYFFEECEGCEWGKNHGLCKSGKSDVYKIKKDKLFTNKFYKEILKEADKL